MKKSLLYVLILFILFNFTGRELSKEKEPIEDSGSVSSISYKINSDSCINATKNFDIKKRGYYIDTFNTVGAPYFYIISMGEQPTLGYKMDVVDLNINKDKNVVVVVKETKPESGQIVSQVLTYPSICLELSEGNYNIIIKNTKGEIFEYIGN